MKVTSEIVNLFMEDGRPVGMLYQNGHTEFFKVSKASKEYVNELLEANKVDDK